MSSTHANNSARAGVLAEAHFFGLWELVDVLEPLALEESLQLETDPPIRRAELVRRKRGRGGGTDKHDSVMIMIIIPLIEGIAW
jgi:hypothetical protein